MITFLLLSVGVIGLFSTGPGGRHDWMRFHADEVTCPEEGCIGNLKWFNKPKLLKCDTCDTEFRIFKPSRGKKS